MLHLSAIDQGGQWENGFPEVDTGTFLLLSHRDHRLLYWKHDMKIFPVRLLSMPKLKIKKSPVSAPVSLFFHENTQPSPVLFGR